MATASADTAIRTYLTALRDPSSLRDDNKIGELQRQLDSADDALERLRLRQQMLDIESPSIDGVEDQFVAHAKAWADQHGVGPEAFQAEGVAASVLRRAGFTGIGRGGGRRGSGARNGRGGGRAGTDTRTRTRVTVDEVRSTIPDGTFTVKQLQQLSGASPAVVRKAVQTELASGGITEKGPDPDHRGPGRAPTLYTRA